MGDRESRQSKMLEMIRSQNGITISELKTVFGVSAVTIRKDLDDMEKDGLIVRTFGGAMPSQSSDPLESFNVRSRLCREEKRQIGLIAAGLIHPMESVIIDAGSTTQEIVRHLHHSGPLTLITPAINVALEACNFQNVTVIVPGGGVLDRFTLSLEGASAEESFSRLHADKVFVGVRGVDVTHGLTDTDTRRIRLKQIMIEVSRQVIVVADSSKIGKPSLFDVAPIQAVHTIITDSGIDSEMAARFKEMGVEILIADENQPA